MADSARQSAPVRSFLARVLGVRSGEKAWRKGAKGEELVAARLQRLPDTWRVLHDIPIDEAGHNVDHLAIGPAGVFCLNAKNLSGSVWVAERAVLVRGQRTDFIRSAEHEAKRVARLLSAVAGTAVSVRPVLVIIADRLTIKAQPPNVDVVARKDIAPWLNAEPARLDAAAIQRLAECASARSTWA